MHVSIPSLPCMLLRLQLSLHVSSSKNFKSSSFMSASQKLKPWIVRMCQFQSVHTCSKMLPFVESGMSLMVSSSIPTWVGFMKPTDCVVSSLSTGMTPVELVHCKII